MMNLCRKQMLLGILLSICVTQCKIAEVGSEIVGSWNITTTSVVVGRSFTFVGFNFFSYMKWNILNAYSTCNTGIF